MPVVAWADLYNDYVNSTFRQPFVSFLGRKASTQSVGHAFVGVGVQWDANLRYYERLFGLYPDGGAFVALKSVITPTIGPLDLTWNDLGWDTEIIKSVDDDTHAKLLATLDKWKNSAPQYSLLGNDALNCNGLMAEVAKGRV
ncbi:hypothetical protein D3C85_1493510 [compost metagenome]